MSMEVKELAQLGQQAFRKSKNLKTPEDVSNYFKEIRKKRINYLRSKTLKHTEK